MESYKKRKETTEGYPTTSNLDKNRKEIAKLYARKTRIKNDYIWKMCIDILKDNPEYIVLEDLNIKGMMKNKNLAKTIAECSWYRIKQTLIYLCNERGIEVRIVDRYYPSSKTCHTCGHKKEDLKLKDRIYVCKECGEVLDRDYNASLNLRDAKKYTIVK